MISASTSSLAPLAASVAASGCRVSWILATIELESRGNPAIVSPTGFRGLMQVGQAVTADWSAAHKVPSPWPNVLDPTLNIRIGSWFLAWCSRRVSAWCPPSHPDHPCWIRACYGWGPGNLSSAVAAARQQLDGRTPTFAELAQLTPDAGKNPAGGWFVRPWTGGEKFRYLVRYIESTGLDRPGSHADHWTTWAIFALLIAGGLILAAAGAALVAR